MSKKFSWDMVIRKVESKLATWKSKMVSFRGRLMLIKVVLFSLPVYFLSMFRAPTCILSLLNKFSKHFFCGGGLHDRKIA